MMERLFGCWRRDVDIGDDKACNSGVAATYASVVVKCATDFVWTEWQFSPLLGENGR